MEQKIQTQTKTKNYYKMLPSDITICEHIFYTKNYYYSIRHRLLNSCTKNTKYQTFNEMDVSFGLGLLYINE